MMAAQAILDRGYGRPTQSIDVRRGWPDGSLYRRECPRRATTTQEWLEGIRREDTERALVDRRCAAVDDEQNALGGMGPDPTPTPGIKRGKYRYRDDLVELWQPRHSMMSGRMAHGSLLRRDASQGQDHRGMAQGQCGVPSVDQTRGRSLISWDRYSDSSAVLACLLGPITPPPASIVGRYGTLTAPVPSLVLDGSCPGYGQTAVGTLLVDEIECRVGSAG